MSFKGWHNDHSTLAKLRNCHNVGEHLGDCSHLAVSNEVAVSSDLTGATAGKKQNNFHCRQENTVAKLRFIAMSRFTISN